VTTIITLDDVKTQLQISGNGSDDVIETWLQPITNAVERYLHEVVVQRTVTDELEIHCSRAVRGRNWIPSFRLWTAPVISITSAQSWDGSTVYDVSNWRPSKSGSGLVRVMMGAVPGGLTEIIYEAGLTQIPADYKQGSLVVLQHCWETRRGAGQIGAGVIGPEERYDPRIMIGIPRKAYEWLGPPRPTIG
jgi:hypothetical protein